MKPLDTAVLVDIDRGGDETVEKVRRLDEEGKHGISIVSVTGLYLGLERKSKETRGTRAATDLEDTTANGSDTEHRRLRKGTQPKDPRLGRLLSSCFGGHTGSAWQERGRKPLTACSGTKR